MLPADLAREFTAPIAAVCLEHLTELERRERFLGLYCPDRTVADVLAELRAAILRTRDLLTPIS